MELIFKSEKALENIKKLRSFLLSDKWMAFLFAFAGLFTTLSALFPGKQIEIKGTLVFVLIIGACLVISDDIMAGLAPFMLTSLIAIKCYDSFDVFMMLISKDKINTKFLAGKMISVKLKEKLSLQLLKMKIEKIS